MLPASSSAERAAKRKVARALRRKIAYQQNPEKFRLKYKEYRAKNPLTEEQKEEVRQKTKAWYEKNRDRALAQKKKRNAVPEIKDRRKNNALVKAYGITLVQYNQMFENQGNKCAICCVAESKKWATDHCHTTGVIRGILCNHCNLMIGHAKESSSILKLAAQYVENQVET
jgi:hypothetical protein